MVLDSDTATVDTESTVSKKRTKTKKISPYKTTQAQFDPDKRREQWLKDLRSGKGRTMSGRPITGTTRTGGQSTSRSTKSAISARSVQVTMNTDSNDVAFLSSSKYLQQKLLASSLIAASHDNHPVTGPNSRGGKQSSKQFAPSSKDPGDMVDEIVELKRNLSERDSVINISKGRMRRLEEENSRKDKQIEQLLNPNSSVEGRRMLTERGGGGGDAASAVVNSLKNKIIKLELTLKEKENELRKLKDDVKTTKAEEMKICMEAFYQEIVRLRAAVHTGKKTNLGIDSSKQERDDSVSNKKMRTLNANILRLSETNKDLELENDKLKKQLESFEESQKGPQSGERDLEDLTREQLLNHTMELQQKLDRYESVMADQFDEEEAQMPGKMKLEGSFADRYMALDKRETELLQEAEKTKANLLRARTERDEWREKYESMKKEYDQNSKNREVSHFESDKMSKYGDESSVARKTSKQEMANMSADDQVQQRRKENEEWKQRAAAGAAASRRLSSSTDQESTRGVDSKKKDMAVQLQSVLRAHLSRSSASSQTAVTSSGSVKAGGVINSTSNAGARRGSGSSISSPVRAAAATGRQTPDSDNESITARTMTARSTRSQLEPISDHSESSSMSGWGDIYNKNKTNKRSTNYNDLLKSKMSSPERKLGKDVDATESDATTHVDAEMSKRGLESDSDATTPRPARRTRLPGDDSFF